MGASDAPVTAVFVDNSKEDLKIADRLTAMGLPCEKVEAPHTIDKLLSVLRTRIDGTGTRLILLDYRLDDEQSMSTARATYRGGSVAAALKEGMPDTPVVLVTTEAKREMWLGPNPRVRGLFDFEVLKEQLIRPDSRSAVVRQLQDLGKGFRRIALLQTQPDIGGWHAVAATLGLVDDAWSLLPAVVGGSPPTGVTQVAHFLLHGLLRYPGLLLDSRETAARLGVSHDSLPTIVKSTDILAARYEGVFAEVEQRWWRGKIDDAMQRFIEASGNSGADRAAAIEAATGITGIRKGHCTWCRGIDIDRTCVVCKGTVDSWHRIPSTVDGWPAWAEPPVVCFECIFNGKADDVTFNPNLLGFVERIKLGDVTRQVLHG